MQSLWSRSVQAQVSCRCRLCLHSVNPVVRRTTTAAPKRRVKAADVFTACYSTILGTAAVIDARSKDARRQELDSRLEKARAALDGHDAPVPDVNVPVDSIVTDRKIRVRYARHWERPYEDTALLQELSSLCDITHRPLPRPGWMQFQLDWVKIEAAIVAEERDPDSGHIVREPRNERQLGFTVETVLNLIDHLIFCCRSQSTYSGLDNTDSSGNAVEDDANDAILREVEHMRDELRRPHFEQPLLHPENAARIRPLLGESIRRIFNQTRGPYDIVGRICYNLLASSTPPTIHTYNSLIAGFNRIQRPDLAQVVIDNYLQDTAWPATEQTILCLLKHYCGITGLYGVRDTVKRMRGVKDTGLNFRISPKQLEHSKEWLDWAFHNCASRKHTFVQRAHRTDDVFDALIKTWLHFGQVGNASMIFVACLRKGAWVPAATLYDLFRACLANLDFAAARKIVRGIAKDTEHFIAMMGDTVHRSSTETSRKVLASFSHLLEICWLPSMDIFTDSPQAAQFMQDLTSLLSSMQIELEIKAAHETLSHTEEILQSSSQFASRLGQAITNLDATETARQKATQAVTGLTRLARIVSLDRRYRDLEAGVKQVSGEVKALLIKRKIGWDFDYGSGLGETSYPSQHQWLRYTATREALHHIQVRPRRMTLNYVYYQLVRNIPNAALATRLSRYATPQSLSLRTLVTFYMPGATDVPKPKGYRGPEFMRAIEEEAADLEDEIRAMLFTQLNGQKQRRLRFLHPNWYCMPVEELVRYNIERCLVIGAKCGRVKDTEEAGRETASAATEEDAAFPGEATGDPNLKEQPYIAGPRVLRSPGTTRLVPRADATGAESVAMA
ncbi:hypothetical protein F4780DRAFT_719652 [Xylariomycetidae sp. FL0641]|nr:hypothetical protein F4780DRAFT_719652 [Xylariomycetidae sp. FL0641]